MNECSVNLPVLLAGQYRVTPKSKGFQSLIRGIGDSKTKHEEDKVIRQEIIHLKQHLVSTHLTSKQTRELLIRLMYCEMLGHNASFGYIHAIKFAQQSTLLEKRTVSATADPGHVGPDPLGYLAASIFLRKDHQLVVLLINTLQKDLESTNVVAKSAALNVFCKLIDAELITAVLPLVFQALKDKRVEIRKKALMALQRVHTINDTLLPNIGEQLSNAILDRDPAVVSASLHLFYDVIKKNPVNYRMYLKAFLQVLRQIMEGKLSEYNFHGVQAPWIQIKLLKILALLGRQQKSISENMSAVLLQMVNTLPTDCNIGCAVMFECIQTISTIYPLQSLLAIASKKTGLFLTSNSSDLKCLGITAMTALVEVDLCYAADPKQQQIIIDCLDDDDLTMRKKTLDLLYKITNSENVALVCAKLLNYLRSTTEQYIKEEVVSNLTKLAEKYAPDSTWYIETINDVIQAGDDFVRPDVVHALMKLIAAGEDDVKTFVVSKYIDVIRKKTLPDLLVQISCWVIGEYGYLVQDSDSLQDIVGQLTVLLDRKFTDPTTCGWIVTAVAKLTARIGTYLPETRGIIDRYRTGYPAELRQRCHEINVLAADMSAMDCAFPVDCSKEDIKVCPTLSFLDDYVSKAYSAGARHYQPHIKNNQQAPMDEPDKPKFRTTPYENPFLTKTLGKEDNPEQEKQSIPVKSSLTNVTPSLKETVVIPKKRASVRGKVSEPQPTPVWGPSGYSGNKIKKQSNEQSKSLQTNTTTELSSKNSSNSSEESSNTTTEVEKTPETFANRSNVVISSKQSLLSSAFFSGVGQSKSTPSPSIEASGDFNQPTTQTIIEPCATDIPLMNTPCDISQAQNEDSESDLNESLEELHLGDSQVALLSEATLESNVVDVSHLGEVNSLTLDQGEFEIDTDNDMAKATNGKDLLVDLDSKVVEKPLISISEFDSERMQDATAFDQNDEIGSREKCLTSEFDTNLKEKEATSSNESNSLLEADSLSATNEVHQQRDHFTELCSDSNVRLVYCTVHKPLQLIVSLKLTNQCQARTAVENVSMTIEPPSNLVAEGSSNKITVDMLAFLDTVTQATLLTCRYPAAHMVLKGSLRYTISRTPKVLYFNQEITSKELLRPLILSTEEFGERWTSTSNGVKQIVSGTSVQSCEQMMTIITNHMNFAVVDIIGCEGIAAGTLLGRDICLLHCNFVKDVEVWIKSSSKLLSEITMQECVSYLQKL